MKRKELKNIAQQIAKAELALQDTTDKEKRKLIEEKIVMLSGKVKSIEDMIAIDDLVQEYLTKEI